jgi:hypothetical protein
VNFPGCGNLFSQMVDEPRKDENSVHAAVRDAVRTAPRTAVREGRGGE